MKPVAIFRHHPDEGPGYLAQFLDRRGVPQQRIAIDAGDPMPEAASAFSGLVFMGGPMSVNDDLPWIGQALRLIREAVDADIPVLGHCLGGQLMSRALGGRVGPNAVKEFGWGRVDVADDAQARRWFGDIRAFDAFHWHGETFSLPEGAALVLSSPYCTNQAFALGPHLGLQCHVEMTAEMIQTWCRAQDLPAANGANIQAVDAILAQTPACLPPMTAVADRLYSGWIEGLRHD